jgi:putative SOS response-associated peptidase YedK
MVRGDDHLFRLDLWGPKPEGSGEAFTILTSEPDPDVAPIHNR